jgi:predicted MFS family arabinose efflux permease
MNNVAPREQSGASSLNYLVAFAAQAAAAFAAGPLMAHFGYPPVLAAAAVLALTAATLFKLLLE